MKFFQYFHHMIDITIFGIHTVLFVDELLNHIWLYPTLYVESDILSYLFIINEVTIFNLEMVRMVHEYPLATNIYLFFCIPSKSDLHWTIYQILLFDHNSLVYFPFVQTPFMTAQHKFSNKSLVISNFLKLFKLNLML